MTEDEWLTATSPTPMLEFLGNQASVRKTRFFAIAACQRIFVAAPDHRLVQMLEIAALLAEGETEASSAEYRNAQEGAFNALNESAVSSPERLLAKAVIHAAFHVWITATAITASGTIIDAWAAKKKRSRYLEQRAQAELLRDIFGNPFSPPHFDPSFRTSTVLALAAQMYALHDFTSMPMLADALQDAGCPEDSELVRHCRGPGPHVRGCHVLDIILQKT